MLPPTKLSQLSNLPISYKDFHFDISFGIFPPYLMMGLSKNFSQCSIDRPSSRDSLTSSCPRATTSLSYSVMASAIVISPVVAFSMAETRFAASAVALFKPCPRSFIPSQRFLLVQTNERQLYRLQNAIACAASPANVTRPS